VPWNPQHPLRPNGAARGKLGRDPRLASAAGSG
jgi:hypothetical protein